MSDPRREAVQPPIDFGRPAERRDPDPPQDPPAPSPLDRPTRRALLLLGTIAAIGIVQVGFLLFVEADRTLRHRTAIAALETELTDLQAEADALRAVAERSGDATFREQLARQQGFLYPNETRVVVLDGDSTP